MLYMLFAENFKHTDKKGKSLPYTYIYHGRLFYWWLPIDSASGSSCPVQSPPTWTLGLAMCDS